MRAVLWDLDGTLVDSAGDIAAAVDRMLVRTGRAPLGEGVVRGFIGDGPFGFAFLLYFVSLVSLIVAMVGMTQVREALRSHFKALFIFALSVVILYCIFMSYFWYTLSHSDL